MIDAIYARQSVDKKDSISIETQIDLCKKESEEINPAKYVDKGYSGKNAQRPDLERLIEDIKKRIVKKVIVYKIDRFSRSINDFANLIKILEEYKVEFISVSEKFDTSTPVGRAMLYIVMVFAQLERETIAERITDNYYARGKKGYFLGGTPPYGFSSTRITIHGQEVSVLTPDKNIGIVMEMYEMYANTDCSLGSISTYLNENEIKAPQGGNWDSMKITRIFRNPVYVKANADVYAYFSTKGCVIFNELEDFNGENGCVLIGKRDKNANKYRDITDHVLSIGQHEGYIDSDTWLLCQYKLNKNKQIKNTGKGKHTWLSGLVKCNYCGYAMTVVQSGNKRSKYFNCRGKTNYKVCDVKQVHHLEDIEDYVKQEIFDKLNNINKVTFEGEKKDSRELNALKLELLDLDQQIGNLVDSLAKSNKTSMKYINEGIEKLDQKKNIVLENINKLTINSKGADKIFEIAKRLGEWDYFDLEEKKRVAYSLIDKVKLSKTEISIEWKY